MSNKFFPAPEVAEIGHHLIQSYYPDLKLHKVRVEFAFRSQTPLKNEKAVWGVARKVSGLNTFLRREKETDWTPGLSDEEIAALESEEQREFATTEAKDARDEAAEEGNTAFFVIVISRPIWDKLCDRHRVALVDHYLMRCGASWGNDGKTRLYIVAPDFEGFNAEIERHGLWRPDAKKLADTMQRAQLSLMFE